MRKNWRHLSRIAAIGVVFLAAGWLVGCRMTPPLEADGLPGEQYLVGGGMMIDWEAPSAGTAYLVEKSSGKIVETRSLAKGDSYTFSIASGGKASEFERMLGVKFTEARLLLYFRPDAATQTAP